MGATSYREHVSRYLSTKPDQIVWCQDMARDLGLTEEQVKNAVKGALDSPEQELSKHITIVAAGKAWRWDSRGKASPNGGEPDKRLFEELVSLDDGRVLVQGSDGKVYWLTAA